MDLPLDVWREVIFQLFIDEQSNKNWLLVRSLNRELNEMGDKIYFSNCQKTLVKLLIRQLKSNEDDSVRFFLNKGLDPLFGYPDPSSPRLHGLLIVSSLRMPKELCQILANDDRVKISQDKVDYAAGAGDLDHFLSLYSHSNLNSGFTLTVASRNGNDEIVRSLLKHQREMCPFDSLGAAIKQGHLSTVKILLTSNHVSKNPYHLALAKDLKHESIVSLFETKHRRTFVA